MQSGPDGVFYARCIPAESQGAKGTTTIYRVKADADEVVDRYDWYGPTTVVLGWSPIVRNKVQAQAAARLAAYQAKKAAAV